MCIMKIVPVNNIQTQFGARLPKSQLGMIKEAAQGHKDNTGVSKVYTILQELDKMGGTNAELKKFPLGIRIYDQSGYLKNVDPQICQLRIDGKLVKEGDTIFETLYEAVFSATKGGKKVKAAESDFNTLCEKNADKTMDDVEQFLR